MKLNLSKVIRWATYVEHAQTSKDELKAAEQLRFEARSFLTQFKWCGAILEEYVGMMYPGIVGVFLFKIQPAQDAVDEWVWVVVGDLPPAYISCEDSPNPAAALDSYIGAMEQWVSASSIGESVEGLIPVNVAATKENAASLGRRLKFLDGKILSQFKDDLSES